MKSDNQRSIATPAKINLFLEITGKRQDGYHLLDTIFIPIDFLQDQLSINFNAHQLCMSCSTTSLPCDQNNLCLRAASAFAQAAQIQPNWHIHLQKNIPIAAGLGGGSSDAAAVLRLLNQQFPERVSTSDLHKIATQLGADIPFFLEPHPSQASGIGEVLTKIEVAKFQFEIILAAPEFPIPAAWAYKALKGKIPNPPMNSTDMRLLLKNEHTAEQIAEKCFNRLEAPILQKFPALRIIREAMLESGCKCVLVSGSGPTLFGVTEVGASEKISERLQQKNLPIKIFSGKV